MVSGYPVINTFGKEQRAQGPRSDCDKPPLKILPIGQTLKSEEKLATVNKNFKRNDRSKVSQPEAEGG